MMAPRHGRVETQASRIVVSGAIDLGDFRRLLAAMHDVTARRGYSDVLLDFGQCETAFPGPMAAVCAAVLRLRQGGVETAAILPSEERLRKLFVNAGWAYLLDPANQPESRFRGYRHVPVVQFMSPAEQKSVVDRMMDATLASTVGLARGDLTAIHWSLNEITDNVLVHSSSPVGGVVHVNHFRRQKRIEFVVADPGVGIPATLREGHRFASDAEALDRAIRQGVTRRKDIGQGNGLYGTFRVAEANRGYFRVHSGSARLSYEGGTLHVRTEAIVHRGTLVVVGLDYSNPAALGEALRLGTGQRELSEGDYIQLRYEDMTADVLVVHVFSEVASVGSRVAGEPFRRKLLNLVRTHPGHRIVLDLSGIDLVSSSFADEAFGKLFVQIGPLQFMRTFTFRNVTPLVKSLIDKAIVQRSAASD
ncbi:MAG: DUF4325 domain-containing protein [Deltaproteobacteria bacterium]|nr:DUF4325 domain-containing protein [Deltaproteobacteria bacterium]